MLKIEIDQQAVKIQATGSFQTIVAEMLRAIHHLYDQMPDDAAAEYRKLLVFALTAPDSPLWEKEGPDEAVTSAEPHCKYIN